MEQAIGKPSCNVCGQVMADRYYRACETCREKWRKAKSRTPLQARNAAQEIIEALLTALPYVEDVLDNPEQLKCFKAGAVQQDVKKIKTALEKAGAI